MTLFCGGHSQPTTRSPRSGDSRTRSMKLAAEKASRKAEGGRFGSIATGRFATAIAGGFQQNTHHELLPVSRSYLHLFRTM